MIDVPPIKAMLRILLTEALSENRFTSVDASDSVSVLVGAEDTGAAAGAGPANISSRLSNASSEAEASVPGVLVLVAAFSAVVASETGVSAGGVSEAGCSEADFSEAEVSDVGVSFRSATGAATGTPLPFDFSVAAGESGAAISTMLPHFGQFTIWPMSERLFTFRRAAQVGH